MMTVQNLTALRNAIGFTQRQMAEAMGLSLRAYQEIESGEATIRISSRHRRLADWVSLDQAVRQNNLAIATPGMRTRAIAYHRLITTQPVT